MPEAAWLFLAFAALGLSGAAPGVTTGDAGELAAASAVLGVAHAPGYPFWTLAARVFGLLMPFGAWTHRMNVFSALLGAAGLALLSDALRRWGFSRPARLGAAALLGLSPVWRECAAVTEVFALHGLLACLLLWLVARERALDDGPAAALGLVMGLSLGNHQTMLLIVPALLLFCGGRARPAVCASLGALAGLTAYAYVPLRAAASPPLDWGHAVTPAAFWRVLLRRDYGSFSLTVEGASPAGLPELARQAWRALAALGPATGLFASAGAVFWPPGLRLTRRAALVWLLCAGPLFLLLGRPGFDAQTAGALERFGLLALIGAALLAAGALQALWLRRPAAAALAAALGAALMLATGGHGRRGDFLAHDYGRALLNALPPGALFVMDGGDDTFYSLAALRWAHGLRPDVELRDRGGVVFPGLYGADFRRLAREEKEARRRAVEAPLARSGRLWYSTLSPNLLPGFETVPAGLLRRPLAPGAAFAEADALDATLAVRARAPGGYRDRALAAFVPYSRGVAALARGRIAEAASWLESAHALAPDALWIAPAVSYALSVAGWRAMQAREHALAARAYRAAAELEPTRADALANLGAALEAAGRVEEAEASYRAAARREPGAARPWEALGALAWSRGRWSEAADAFDQAAAREPGRPSHADWAAAARRKMKGAVR